MAEYPWHQDAPADRISDSEIAVQKACLRMIAALFPKTKAAAIPNGGKRTLYQQRQVKSEGVSSGFPDLVIVGPGGLTAFVEIKAGSSTSPTQKDWLRFLEFSGHKCGVFRSDKTLEAKMREWGFR